MQTTLDQRDENAERVIKTVHKAGKAEVDPIRGLFASPVRDKKLVIEYEPDSDLRDTEQVPLRKRSDDGGTTLRVDEWLDAWRKLDLNGERNLSMNETNAVAKDLICGMTVDKATALQA